MKVKNVRVLFFWENHQLLDSSAILCFSLLLFLAHSQSALGLFFLCVKRLLSAELRESYVVPKIEQRIISCKESALTLVLLPSSYSELFN